MMKRKSFRLLMAMLLVLPILTLTACPPNQKTLSEMSGKEKATWMLSVYNAQYADYKVQAARTDLDEAKKEILREKKKILTEVYPLIKIYVGLVDTGVLPDVDLETTIIQNLERLLGML